jgi:UDP-N-acetylmuramyl pentapeptide phosphotransferase/UDP-N-acetylglucosamine-1-phosphate transferase
MSFSFFGLISFLLSIFFLIIIQKIFINKKKFDDFNHRTSHNTLATKTGGISIFLCLFIISVFYYIKGVEIYDFSLLIPVSIMFIIGVYDDLYNADFKLKFILQIIVAKIIIDQGFVIDSFHGVFGIYELPRIFSQIFTGFVFLVIVNAINFIDGIDGLAITEVIKTILIIELISVEKTPLNLIGLIVIFSLIPLYYFNYKRKKKIFLGDGGSLFLGTLISIYIFYLLSENYNPKASFMINKALLSIIIIIYPLIDLLRVFIIRIYNKRSPFIADKNHIHHKILDIVKSHFLTVITIQVISIFFIFTTIILFN